jgi:hypothetical protein
MKHHSYINIYFFFKKKKITKIYLYHKNGYI